MDLSTGGTFNAYTIEDAEQGTATEPQLCQGTANAQFCNDGSGNLGYGLGPEQPGHDLLRHRVTHQLTFFDVYPGYDGVMKFTLPAKYNGVAVPANTTGADIPYVMSIPGGLLENGKAMDMGWTASGVSHPVANRLYLAMRYTFQPALLAVTTGTLNEMTDPGYDCLISTKCRTSANPDKSFGNFGSRPVGIYANFAQSNSAEAITATTPSDIYMYPVKFEPYSLSSYNEGLDTFITANADPTLKPFGGQPIYGPYAPAMASSARARRRPRSARSTWAKPGPISSRRASTSSGTTGRRGRSTISRSPSSSAPSTTRPSGTNSASSA